MNMRLLRPGMVRHLSGKVAACGILLLTIVGSTVCADETHAEFIDKLRQRKYFDTALEYIEQLQQRSDLPQDFANTLELERGITYREMGSSLRVPEDREQAQGQAERSLKKFTSEHPQHPRAAYANFELGQLLLDRARTLLWDADAPSNADRRAEIQTQARALIDQAQAIYQKSHDQYDAQQKAFPSFIDKTEDPEQFEARQDVFYKYLKAAFNLARCTYERGQTFEKGTKERTETLIKASEEFEAISSAWRSFPVGRHAYLMMGKCFQEQDDISRALGLYNTIINDDSQHPAMLQLKSYALQFRLICLNHEKRSDYQLVINEATRWLNDKINRSRLYTEQGLGILWEKARAEEQLSKDRTLDAKQQTALKRQTIADANTVAKFPSPYREPAVAMARRINASLGEKDAEPKDFDTAFERGSGLITQKADLDQAVKDAKSADERQKAIQARDAHMNEISRVFELALSMRDEDSDPKAVAQARYFLSYAYMVQRKNYEAIILSRYCMDADRLTHPDSALNATEIAIQSAVQAFNDAGDNQEFELDLLKQICEQIVSQYPQSARGNEARIRLGQVYRDLKQPLKAAETYLTVPENSSDYASSRLQAGQSYWLAWLTNSAGTLSAGTPGDGQAEHDEAAVSKWKTDATKLLQEGLTLARQKLGDNVKPTSEMAAAEVSLATINNMDGNFDQTIQRLTSGGETSVISLLQVPEGESRPDKGVQSSDFAGQAYRLLLRAYVGVQQIDNALATMNGLEAIGGQDTTAVYTQLGQELQAELERLSETGEAERLAQVRSSFEQFLEKVYAQRDQSDYNSLLWIGETYFGLGKGVKEDTAAASAYFQKATQAYQEILQNNLAADGAVTAIKLRLIRCKRAQGNYEEAVTLAQEVLTASPLSLDVQFEAAHTLADWGADPNGQPEKLLTSIKGVDKVIWGWSGITSKLQARQSSPDWKDLKDRFLEARLEYIRSRYRYAKTGAADGRKQLQSGLAEITIFAQVFPDLDDAWFAKFDQLYQDIQVDLGQAAIALERPKPLELPPQNVAANSEEQEADNAATPQPVTQSPPPSEGPGWLMGTLAIALAAGGGFAFYKLMSKPQKRRRTFAPAGGSFTPPPGTGSDATGGDAPDFSSLAGNKAGAAVAAPPRKKTASKAAATPGTARKKRVLTPEEMVKYKAAKAAKAKAAAQQAAAGGKKVVKKKGVQRPSTSAAGTSPPVGNDPPVRKVVKKRVKKRPPQPPPNEG